MLIAWAHNLLKPANGKCGGVAKTPSSNDRSVAGKMGSITMAGFGFGEGGGT